MRIAAIARDASIVLATVSKSLETKSVEVLAKDFSADPATTEVKLLGELVVAVGKLDNVRAPWLLKKGAPPKALPLEWCRTEAGVAWVMRDPASAIVRFASKDGEETAEPVQLPLEAEVHIACGRKSVVVFVPDGPRLQAARVVAGSKTAATLVELEKDGDFKIELRDRQMLVRDDGALVVLHITESTLAIREVRADDPGKWVEVTDEKGKAFALDADADILASAAGPTGPTFVLVSAPMKGACPSGDPPRRIVLHTIESGKATTRPIVELPCGVDAIPARMSVESGVAHLSWTEPLDTCKPAQVGLSVGAIVTATSDKPGARRLAMAAEAIVRVDDARFLGVVRPGGCVEYGAAGNGALAWVPMPK